MKILRLVLGPSYGKMRRRISGLHQRVGRSVRQRVLHSMILVRSPGSYTMAIPYTALGCISLCFTKVFFNGAVVAMTSFSSCSTNHPAGVNSTMMFLLVSRLIRSIISVSIVFISSRTHSKRFLSSQLSLYRRFSRTRVTSRSATWEGFKPSSTYGTAQSLKFQGPSRRPQLWCLC